jgi:DNA-binding IclR family transcriptional regulator
LNASSKDRRFVNSLARGLDVLRCFAPGDGGLGNTEIARRTGLPKPTISRLTFTLTQLGYLIHSERQGAYQLGPGVLALGYAALSGFDIRERARPLLQQLSNDVDATVALGARDRLDAVYLEVCRGPAPVTLRIDVGTRNPLPPTAMGRALLAGTPADERASLMQQVRRTVADDAEFEQLARGVERAVQDVATRGFCASIGEWRADVNAVGVPLVTRDGAVHALICGGPAFRLTAGRLEQDCGPPLVALAKRISAMA